MLRQSCPSHLILKVLRSLCVCVRRGMSYDHGQQTGSTELEALLAGIALSTTVYYCFCLQIAPRPACPSSATQTVSYSEQLHFRLCSRTLAGST